MARVLVGLVLTAAALSGSPADAHDFAVSLARRGPRPAAGVAERRAHARVARRFDRAGLEVSRDHFRVPGIGRSRNVYGIRDVPGTDCLRVVVAHADTVPPSPGAHDNASGVGVLVELAPGLRAMKLGVPDEPVRHTAADTADRLQRGAFKRALRIVIPFLNS